MVRLLYIFKRIATGVHLRPWGSFFTLIACWFALSQLSVVICTVNLAGRAALIPGTNSTVMAYLRGDQQQSTILSLQERLLVMEGVSRVSYIPRDEGLIRMKQWLGCENPLIEGLDPEILPDAFEIGVKPSYVGKMETLMEKLREIPSIEDVRCHKGILGRIAGAYHSIVFAGLFMALVVIICLALVLFLSIRVGIITRSQEIEVLNLLGAGRGFLFAPYIIEALLYGLAGSILASLTAWASTLYLLSRIPVLLGIVSPPGINQLLVMIVFACLCSVTGAILAIRRSIDA
ncbi:MAG: hypothetical protein JXM72_12025 [Deltaproteobacteria bacterium]|nr:hypothetical protein [Deltaproteobacteria bacterium]